MEARATNLSYLFATLVELVILLEMVLLGVFTITTAIVAVATFISLGLYAAGRMRPTRGWMVWIFFGQLILLAFYDWMLWKGTGGLALPVLVVLFGVLPILLTPSRLLWGYLLLSLLPLGMVVSLNHWFAGEINDPEALHDANLIFFEALVVGIGLTALAYQTKAASVRSREKVLELNARLEEQNRQLTDALAEVKTLRGIVPICAHCKSVRNDQGYYESVEHYMSRHAEVEFSHGFCPKCEKKYYGGLLKD